MPIKLVIKNMVCPRCVEAVRNVARELNLDPLYVSLGELILDKDSMSETELEKLDKSLEELGFKRIDERRSQMIQKIKSVVIRHIHHADGGVKNNWSDLIGKEIPYEYSYISNLFSQVEGITLEQFIIRQKIEKVKELLFYDEMNLGEIAWQMGYSSPSYLNSQFKKVTGMTPGEFRKLHQNQRKSLDEL